MLFAIDRIMVFNTVPRDDYAPFLLWVIGAPGGAFPGSPYGYRLLTILAAVPLYHILPALILLTCLHHLRGNTFRRQQRLPLGPIYRY